MTKVKMRPIMAARPFHTSARGANPRRPTGVSSPGKPLQSTDRGSHRYSRPPRDRRLGRHFVSPSPLNGTGAGDDGSFGGTTPAMKLGARVAMMMVAAMVIETPCVRLYTSCVVKLRPVATSTSNADVNPSMATRPLTASGTHPSIPNVSIASELSALSSSPVPAGPADAGPPSIPLARWFSSSISSQSLAESRSGPRGCDDGGAIQFTVVSDGRCCFGGGRAGIACCCGGCCCCGGWSCPRADPAG
mmetsp:Transcript_19347/g.48339  ORF Transcript_19347/g.48339 Transcript_19347/m.48339 type:complete len:247 (-) Transcript_19347:358-1098(-)